MLSVLLLAALPEEYRYLAKYTGRWQLVCQQPYVRLRRSFGDKEVTLVETGMGRERVLPALHWAAGETLPDVVVSFGFGGSLTEAFPVGLVAAGTEFLYWQAVDGCALSAGGHVERADEALLDFCRQQKVPTAQIVTVDRPLPKRLLSSLFAKTPSIMDMESYFAARFALQNGVPFCSFRAISDGVRDEIGFDLDEISSNGRVRIAKVLALTARRPHLVTAFYGSWRRSRRAGPALAKVLAAFLDLPAEQMRATGER